jgi:hypothetical protein
MALAKPSTEIQDGVPPENLSPDILAKAVAVKDNSTETVLAYSFASSFASSGRDNVKGALLRSAERMILKSELAHVLGGIKISAVHDEAAGHEGLGTFPVQVEENVPLRTN